MSYTKKPTSPRRRQTKTKGDFSPKKTYSKNRGSVSAISQKNKRLSSSHKHEDLVLTVELKENLQKHHLVIDLDATFVSSHMSMHSYHRLMKNLENMNDVQGAASIKARIYAFDVEGEKMWTVLRPGALEFIEFAMRYFRIVSVWSAGQKSYVDAVVNILFKPHMSRPALVFHWEDCARDRPPCRNDQCDIKVKMAASPTTPDNVSEFSKPLIEMARHCARGGDTDSRMENEPLARMLMLDDRNDIAKHNPNNLIHNPPFEPNLTIYSLSLPDTVLDDLAKWLMKPEVILAADVRALDKSRIFSTI
jgi:hypothetical protein